MAECVGGLRSLVLLLFVSEWVGWGARERGSVEGEGFLFQVQVSNKRT